MMRSMYSGVSGLMAHQAKMDVIGNNIANVNTVGFKKSKTSFTEVFYQTVRGASSPQSGRGGTNPMQVGLGVNVSAITVIHSQGTSMRTDNPTDLMIDGAGYFVVSNDENGQNKSYTRAGNFSIDAAGNIVNPNGYNLLDVNNNKVRIDLSKTIEAKATTGLKLTGNLNYDKNGITKVVKVYDSLGKTRDVTIEFGDVTPKGAGAGSTRRVTISTEKGKIEEYDLHFKADGTLDMDPSGTVYNMTKVSDGSLAISTTGTPNKLTLTYDGVDPINLEITNDMFNDKDGNPALSQFSSDTNAVVAVKDGNAAGAIESFTISASGEVIAVYTNGQMDPEGDRQIIQLANFDNPSGLQKIGGNLFIETVNSGAAKYGRPASGSFGDIMGGTLEMSNVDLSQEFTDMIATQRGFQANSRIITTTDEMLQELVNLKR